MHRTSWKITAPALCWAVCNLIACAPSSDGGAPSPSTGGAPNMVMNTGGAPVPIPTTGTGGELNFDVPDAMTDPDALLSPESGCEAVRDTRPVAPNVLIVLDRSGSMLHEGIDRWTPAVQAISDVTSALESRVQFGLSVFPLVTDQTQNCGTGELRLAPALNQSSAIVSDLDGAAKPHIGGGTPTSATLDGALSVLSGLPGSSYVLLVTDGAPNCNDAADASQCDCTRSPIEYCRGGDIGGGALVEPTPRLCLDDAESVAAVDELAQAGIKTLVIGYDTDAWSATLDAMAAAGETGRTTHYAVADGVALQAALDQASAYVVSCTFELSEAPPSWEWVDVQVDERRIKHVTQTDGSRGFRLVGDRTVELVGETCRSVSDGSEHDIVIVRECEPVIR